VKLIIAGTRTFHNLDEDFFNSLMGFFRLWDHVTEIVSGGADGVDEAGERYAAWAKLKCSMFPADWEKYGKAAGPMRNAMMADYADGLLLVWDGKSPGSSNMKREMRQREKPVFELVLKTYSGDPSTP
jgi:hypothetical protein